MPKPAIVIAEGDQILYTSLHRMFRGQGFEVLETADAATALQAVQTRHLDLILVGPGREERWDGVDAARQIRSRNAAVPVILVAATSSEERVIAAVHAGITDYFTQPLSLEAVAASVNRCLADPCQGEALANHNGHASTLVQGWRMIGNSTAILKVKACIGKLAGMDSTVLITGESGTGKELVAEMIHRNSARRQKSLICLNCAAIPDSLVESELFGYEKGAFTGAHSLYDGKLKLADGGTVFFDEIGDMSPSAQAKVLRTIEGKEIYRLGGAGSIALNIRIIAATNQDLERQAELGKFRKDLYYRLNVARIHLPPLRDRKEDIPPLVEHYLRECNSRFARHVEGVTDETADFLLHYDWPGNVRELQNLLEAVFVNLDPAAATIAFTDLPELFRRRFREAAELSQDERERVLSALFSAKWNKSKAAQTLHWSRMTLYRKMAKHQIPVDPNGDRHPRGDCPAPGTVPLPAREPVPPVTPSPAA